MKKKVLVVGDAMVDRYVSGVADRISPEAPTPVLRVTGDVRTAGGAANVARNASVQGVSAGLIGLRGPGELDPDAEWLENDLQTSGVWCLLVTRSRYRMPLKTRVTAGGQQLLRFDRETPLSVQPSATRLVEEFNLVAGEVGVLVLSDYGKGALSESAARQLIAAAAGHGIPVVVSPRGDVRAKYTSASVIVMNWVEAAAYVKTLGVDAGNPPEGDEAFAKAASSVVSQALGCPDVVITMGGHGLHWYNRETKHTNVFAKRRAVFDVTGAGDTLLGVLAAEMLKGTGMAEALVRANAAAGVAVSRPGTAVVNHLEIDDDLGWGLRGARKVLSIQAGKAAADEQKAQKRAVGFVFGGFHRLKPGHVRFLAEAREQCDYLVVGVEEQPSPAEGGDPQDLADRLEVLAALDNVNVVVPIPAEAGSAVVRELRPDKLFVTEAYSTGEEADVVASRGGLVVTLPWR